MTSQGEKLEDKCPYFLATSDLLSGLIDQTNGKSKDKEICYLIHTGQPLRAEEEGGRVKNASRGTHESYLAHL